MPDLKPCPFCGYPKIKISTRREVGVPSGDNGWCAEITCICGARMKRWALKKSLVEARILHDWNRRAGEENENAV